MSADQLIFEESLDVDSTQPIFTDKDYTYILDSNNGSYNSQITFESSQLSNNDRYINWSEAYIEIPLVLSLNATAVTTGFHAAAAQYSASLKSGFWNLINSISVDVNGQNVVSLTPFTNMYINFKALTTFSQEDQEKFGGLLGFAKDDSLSFQYSNAASTNGIYTNNNQNYVNIFPTNVATAKTIGNLGLLKRQLNHCFDPAQVPFSTFNSATVSRTIGKNYFEAVDSTTTNNGYKVWYILATIRLKEFDFFDKMPLIKGSQVKIIINTNTSTSRVACTTVGTLMTSTATNISLQGGTNPVIISSAAANNGMAALVALGTNPSYDLNLSILRCTNSSLPAGGANGCPVASHQSLTSCRLYVPLYQFNPDFAQKMLSVGSVKKVQYRDIYEYTVNNVSAGGTFNSILSNGIVNPKRLVVVPIQNNGAGNLSPLASPFDTAPCTTAPLAAITQFNVMVGGINVFSLNQNLDFEVFQHELSETGVNFGKTTGLGSGLITALDFQTSYRYLTVDLSRRLPNEDLTPKSIQIMGTNASLIGLDLYCFVEYEKEIKIDITTGQIVR